MEKNLQSSYGHKGYPKQGTESLRDFLRLAMCKFLFCMILTAIAFPTFSVQMLHADPLHHKSMLQYQNMNSDIAFVCHDGIGQHGSCALETMPEHDMTDEACCITALACNFIFVPPAVSGMQFQISSELRFSFINQQLQQAVLDQPERPPRSV